MFSERCNCSPLKFLRWWHVSTPITSSSSSSDCSLLCSLPEWALPAVERCQHIYMHGFIFPMEIFWKQRLVYSNLWVKAGLAFLLLLGEHILSTIFQVLFMIMLSYYTNWKHWYVHSAHLRSLEILGSWQPPVPPAPRRIWHLLLAFVGAVLRSTHLYTDARIHIYTDKNKPSF